MIKNSFLNEHNLLIVPRFLFRSLRTYDTIFLKIHEFYHVCTALNLHVNVHAMWTCKRLWWQEAAACVKYLCVCHGCLQLCRRPSIMHASTLLPQLWSQPWAEVGALYHAAAHFKAGTRNRVSGGETRNEAPERRSPTIKWEEVIKQLLCLFATSEWLTSIYISLPPAPDEEAHVARVL